MKAGSSGMPTVGIDRFESRLACLAVIWGGVRAAPEDPYCVLGVGRRLDRAVARPHGPPFR
jgi:hypothetical protein